MKCPECSAQIYIHPSALMAYCESCSSIIANDGKLMAGQKLAHIAKTPTRFLIGRKISIDGIIYDICGCSRFGHKLGFWDEWHLLSGDSDPSLIIENEGLHVICRKTEVLPLFKFQPVNRYERANLAGYDTFVQEAGKAVLIGMKGNIFEKLLPVSEFYFIKGLSGDKVINMSFFDDRTAVKEGSPLKYDQIKIE